MWLVLVHLLEVVEFDSQRLASTEVIKEGCVCLLGLGFVALGQVDKVGAMGKNVPDS